MTNKVFSSPNIFKRAAWLLALLACCFVAVSGVSAAQHFATRLGNPATRFADPLQKPEDLRRMLTSEKLRADVDFIARESGFKGDLEDLRRAALSATILELRIPHKTVMPAMSTREKGKAVLLREVMWMGTEPIEAYEFYFASQGRRYRVVTPKPCANFWVEDYGVELRPALAMQCSVPEEIILGRPARFCLNVKNSGNETEPAATVTLAVPAGVTVVNAAGATAAPGQLVWQLGALPPGRATNLCAAFQSAQTATLPFVASARGRVAAPVESRCETRAVGLPSVLFEVVDVADPVEVGKEQTYEIKVVNQGTAALSNVKVVCTLEESQEFVSGAGASAVSAEARVITLATLPELAVKQQAAWRVVVKALQAGDVRFATELNADQFKRPISETESTQQY